MNNAIARIKSFYAPANDEQARKVATKGKASMFYISPVQFSRMRHDFQSWRETCNEAEQAWYPYRVKMQKMFLDTVLNEHVKACIRKRKRLTTQRKFKLCDENG